MMVDWSEVLSPTFTQNRAKHIMFEMNTTTSLSESCKPMVKISFFNVDRFSEGWSRIDSTSLFLLAFTYYMYSSLSGGFNSTNTLKLFFHALNVLVD